MIVFFVLAAFAVELRAAVVSDTLSLGSITRTTCRAFEYARKFDAVKKSSAVFALGF